MSAPKTIGAPKNTRWRLHPRPAWSYRGARRNAHRWDWGPGWYLPGDANRRRRVTGNQR